MHRAGRSSHQNLLGWVLLSVSLGSRQFREHFISLRAQISEMNRWQLFSMSAVVLRKFARADNFFARSSGVAGVGSVPRVALVGGPVGRPGTAPGEGGSIWDASIVRKRRTPRPSWLKVAAQKYPAPPASL